MNYTSGGYPLRRSRATSNRERLQNFGPGGAGMGLLILVIIVLGLLGGIVYGAVSWYTSRSTVTVVVNDKERVCSGGKDNKCKYLVYTDRTTYAVYDSWFAKGRQVNDRKMSRFASSDFYGAIRPCHRYQFTIYGKRWPLFSNYQNIVKATDLGVVDGCTPPR